MSDLTQANVVAARVEELLDRYQANAIAVLFRAGYQSYHLEVALSKRGIKFRKYGGLRYAEAVHVKDVVAFVRLAINPLDMPSFERVAGLSKGVGTKTAEKIYHVAAQGDFDALLDSASTLSGIELFDAYRQAETLLLEDGAVIPLYFETSYYASGKGVTGIGFSPFLTGVSFQSADRE